MGFGALHAYFDALPDSEKKAAIAGQAELLSFFQGLLLFVVLAWRGNVAAARDRRKVVPPIVLDTDGTPTADGAEASGAEMWNSLALLSRHNLGSAVDAVETVQDFLLALQFFLFIFSPFSEFFS